MCALVGTTTTIHMFPRRFAEVVSEVCQERDTSGLYLDHYLYVSNGRIKLPFKTRYWGKDRRE